MSTSHRKELQTKQPVVDHSMDTQTESAPAVETGQQNPKRKAQAFFVSQLVVLFLVVGVVTAGTFNRSASTFVGPKLDNEPLQVTARYDDPLVVTDDQLLSVLKQLEPSFGPEAPKINFIDHAIRFWDVDAHFDCSECWSGEAMRELLTNDERFQEVWGDSTSPLLVPNQYGIDVRMQQGPATASHVDHTLASLAEVGTPLDYPITTRQGQGSVRDLMEHALANFSLNQLEYEWTVLALALYSPYKQSWQSREGQSIDFDLLVDRIIRQRYSQGVCYGNHRLYTLTVLLRIDESHDILSDHTVENIHQHLMEATARLVQTQSTEGFWDAHWAGDRDATTDEPNSDELRGRILATGHALEWWAMAPPELLPPREVIIRAAQWLVVEIESMSDSAILNNYTFLTHAGRALTLWRGGTPMQCRERFHSEARDGA